MGGVRVAAAVVDDAPSSSSNNLASTTDRPAAAAPAAPASQSGSFFDLDGDGDTDVFDVFYGFYVLLVNSLHAVDVYFVGFPVFSSAATACAFVALSFQISGVAQLSEGVQTLSDLINANLSIGSLGTFMTMSVVGVLLLNVCVITNGLLSWCARIERKEAVFALKQDMSTKTARVARSIHSLAFRSATTSAACVPFAGKSTT